MSKAFALRSSNSGPQFDGNAGDVLSLTSDGKAKFVAPGVVPGAGEVSVVVNDTPDFLVNKLTGVSGVVLTQVEPSPGFFKLQLGITPAPFRAQYYMDPAYTGTSTGSAASPFKTIAAAFAFAASLGITSGVIYLPNATVTENVVMPTGGFWELSCPNQKNFPQTATLAGTVLITTAATTFHAFTGLQITGAISGNAAAQTRVLFDRCRLTSTLNLTNSGGASLRVIFTADGPGLTGVNGFVTGAVTIGGGIVVTRGQRFNALVTVAADSQFSGADLEAGFASNAAGLVTAQFFGCIFNSAQNFNALTGSIALQLDGSSAAALMAVGMTTTGTVAVKTLNSNGASRTTIAANVAATTVAQRYPASMMEAQAVLTILTPGTTGSAVVNAIYTDMTGTVRTVPITTGLDITGAAGTAQRGTLPFEQNGATVIQYSVTGIVTPGALSLSLAVAVRQLN